MVESDGENIGIDLFGEVMESTPTDSQALGVVRSGVMVGISNNVEEDKNIDASTIDGLREQGKFGENDIVATEEDAMLSSAVPTASQDHDSAGRSDCSSEMTSSLSSFDLPGQSSRPLMNSASTNLDAFASMMAKNMETHEIHFGKALLERAACVDSINWLGLHLPECVVAYLIDVIETEEKASEELNLEGHLSLKEKESGETSEDDKQLKDRMQTTGYPSIQGAEPDGKISRCDSKDGSNHCSDSHDHDADDETDSLEGRGHSGAIPQPRTQKLPQNSCPTKHTHAAHYAESSFPEPEIPSHQSIAYSHKVSNSSSQIQPNDKCSEKESATHKIHSMSSHSRKSQSGSWFGEPISESSTSRQPITQKERQLSFILKRRGSNGSSFSTERRRVDRRGSNGSAFSIERRRFGRRGSNGSSFSIERGRIGHRGSNESSFTAHSVASSNTVDFKNRVVVESGSKFAPINGCLTNKSTNEICLQRRALGIDNMKMTFKPIESSSKVFHDPFPCDSDDEEVKKQKMRQNRLTKTRESLQRLLGKDGESSHTVFGQSTVIRSLSAASENESRSSLSDMVPPATRHDCALLFIDISGFTKLSTALDVEPLSKTINAYFQMIVDEVEAFGGDVLKFAGDAVFAEWQATSPYPRELATLDGYSMASGSCGSIKPWHGLEAEECVSTAAACAAKIVNTCADYKVFAGRGGGGPQVATLNVHCAIGFGEVVGVHVGDQATRMEYIILGDPIDQVSEAILVASRGHVVASPEAFVVLEESAICDKCIQKADRDNPIVIATKETSFFQPKRKVHVQQNWTTALKDFTTKPRERLARRCNDWDISALLRLRQRMSLYVHPVVVHDDFATTVYPGDRTRAQERHRSEAELRSVYTVFIMPLITARLTGDDEGDGKVLVLMNDILLIVTKELARFKGQLRQFIVDDKGVVIIANFGLRGSTFPNMVSERALPFTTTVQTLLKSELDTECQMGATFGKAYCGVVGGVSRHEYAVLGPSVNLAARLMANPKNTGFLVDDGVRQKAGHRAFQPLPPVKAKGYTDLVPIFEPLVDRDRNWESSRDTVIGRENEQTEVVKMAETIIDCGGPSKMIWVIAESGAGKSSLVFEITSQIEQMCTIRSSPHLLSRNVCSEEDMFVPFSIARSLFLDILTHLQGKQDVNFNTELEINQIKALIHDGARKSDVPQALVALVHMCQEVEIPTQYIEVIGRLIFTRNPVDALTNASKHSLNDSEMHRVAGFLVRLFLDCTIEFDLVIVAFDNLSNMDEMSWKLIQLFWDHGMNVMVIGASRPVTSQELHMNKKFWSYLHNEGIDSGRFVKMTLSPMKESDVELLVAKKLGHKDSKIDPKLSRDVYVQSGGMPHLASAILHELYKNDLLEKSEKGVLGWRQDLDGAKEEAPEKEDKLEVGNIGELVLHRMDALPSSVRAHLNLGAILGSSFELIEVVTVFERYRGIQNEEKRKHAKSVHESLEKAVKEGILQVENKESRTSLKWRHDASEHPYGVNNKTYMFAHDVWRNNILRLTLDEWKRDMHSMIAQSMETVLESDLANDYRVLSKLFGHWKESGSASKATKLALKIGLSLEAIGLPHQSLIIYRESLDMWKSPEKNGYADETLGGVTKDLLDQMQPDDLELLIGLNVSLGRCFTNIMDPKESIKAYQTALNIIHRAPSSAHIADRSIIFPVFSGLFIALRFSLNDDFVYEQGLVRMFLRETKLHNDPIHFSRALAMQSEMMARHGRFEVALDIKSQMVLLYDVDEQTSRMSRAYGSDRCGQCIAQSALWHLRLGDSNRSLEVCKQVLVDLLPCMDPQNIHNAFLMLYPVIWVMKDNGMAIRAKEAFEKFVVKNFETLLDERGFTSDRQLHEPILMLLTLSGIDSSTEHLERCISWALDAKSDRFDSEINFATASVGRNANSITAEICLLLATNPNTPKQNKRALVEKGYELASGSVELTRSKESVCGMINAFHQAKPVHDALEELHVHLSEDSHNRRTSCGF